MSNRRILITGVTGTIGALLADRLEGDYEVIRQARRSDGDDRIRIAELDDVEGLTATMEGVDTVIHMAGEASPEGEWESVLEANIIGFRNVIEAARLAGVRRFVFASSNHAMGMYDRLGEWPVYPHHLPRGDSLYGVSKVFGETLGRFYHDEHGMDFIALRIGWMTDDPMAVDADILHAMWLSEDDCVEVVRCAIEAESRFGLYYAISDNPNRRWDLTNTMLDLGYRPKDAWTDASGQTEQVTEGGEPAPEDWPKNS